MCAWVDRRELGITYHCVRNTAATNLRAGAMADVEARKVLGHKTPSTFRRCNLGDTEGLRKQLAARRAVESDLATPEKISGRSRT